MVATDCIQASCLSVNPVGEIAPAADLKRSRLLAGNDVLRLKLDFQKGRYGHQY